MADCNDVTFEKEQFPSDGDIRQTMGKLISRGRGYSSRGAIQNAFMHFISRYDTDSLSDEQRKILNRYQNMVRDSHLADR